MEEGLKIVISADVKQALAQIKQMEAELAKLPKGAKLTQDNFKLLSGQTTLLGGSFTKTAATTAVAAVELETMAVASEAAAVGVSGLEAVLTGGLAIAATFIVGKVAELVKKQLELKATVIELTKVETEYSDLLAKEKTNLDNLFAVATNANVPLLARKDAIKELRDQYSAYLKDFSDEEILAGKAEDAYNKLAIAIGKVALARAASNIQTENNEKILRTQLEIDKQRLNNEQELIKQRTNVLKAINSFNDQNDPTGGRRKTLALSLATLENQIKQQGYDKIIEKQKIVNKLSEDNLKLTKLILENQVNPFKEGKPGGSETEKTKANNKELERTGILLKDQLLSRTKLNELTNKDFQKLSEINSLLDLQNKLVKDTPTGGNELSLADRGNLDFAGGFKNAEKPLDKMIVDAKILSDTINNGINGGIDTFFNALANNQDPFKALAQSVQRLVVELAAAVVKALILKAVTAAITGGGSAVGGAASKGLDMAILRGGVLGR